MILYEPNNRILLYTSCQLPYSGSREIKDGRHHQRKLHDDCLKTALQNMLSKALKV
jgi:hypothetical protein